MSTLLFLDDNDGGDDDTGASAWLLESEGFSFLGTSSFCSSLCSFLGGSCFEQLLSSLIIWSTERRFGFCLPSLDRSVLGSELTVGQILSLVSGTVLFT